MISLYEEDGVTRRLLGPFNGLRLNDPADDPRDTIEVNAIAQLGSYTTATEIDPADDGSEANPVYRSRYVLRLDMVARAKSQAALADRVHAIAQAFDPALARLTSPSTNGILPLNFDVPTEDTATYPTGIIPCRYFVRARSSPIPPSSAFTGLAAMLSVDLDVFDPRRYTQAVDGTSFASIALQLDNSHSTYPSWPTVLFSMSGSGSATYTLARSAVGTYPAPTPLVLNLSSLMVSDQINIDMKARTITLLRSGVSSDATSLRVSGDYFQVVPGIQTLTPSNSTNVLARIITWNRAFVA